MATQQELITEQRGLTLQMKSLGKQVSVLLKSIKPRKMSSDQISKIMDEIWILNAEISRMNSRCIEIMKLQGYEPTKNVRTASVAFHNIMAASVKGNPKPKKADKKKKSSK